MSTDLSRTPVHDAVPAEQVATRCNSCMSPGLEAQRTLATHIVGQISTLRTNITASFITSE